MGEGPNFSYRYLDFPTHFSFDYKQWILQYIRYNCSKFFMICQVKIIKLTQQIFQTTPYKKLARMSATLSNTLSQPAMLSPTLFGIVDYAVEKSIRLHMAYNLRDCLGNDCEVVEETPSKIQRMLLDCDIYLQQAKTKVDYKLDTHNVFTGRYMLYNNYGERMLLFGDKEELIRWVTPYIPDSKIAEEVRMHESELLAWIWLTYLTTQYDKVVEYYNNEKEFIKKRYIMN